MSYAGQKNALGERHGHGTYIYQNSFFKYEGEWQNGIKQGHGVLYLGNGNSYEGTFEAGEMTGSGLKRWADGSSYSGQFLLGEMHGQGVFISADGEKYEGEFVNNKRHGEGEITFPNGDIFIGTFVNHKREGNGKLEKAGGGFYEGEWRSNVRTGEGIEVWPNENRYEGFWFDDVRHGHGKMYDLEAGIEYEGLWDNDRPVDCPTHIKFEDDLEIISAHVGGMLPALQISLFTIESREIEAHDEPKEAEEKQKAHTDKNAKNKKKADVKEESQHEEEEKFIVVQEHIISKNESGRKFLVRARKMTPEEVEKIAPVQTKTKGKSEAKGRGHNPSPTPTKKEKLVEEKPQDIQETDEPTEHYLVLRIPEPSQDTQEIQESEGSDETKIDSTKSDVPQQGDQVEADVALEDSVQDPISQVPIELYFRAENGILSIPALECTPIESNVPGYYMLEIVDETPEPWPKLPILNKPINLQLENIKVK